VDNGSLSLWFEGYCKRKIPVVFAHPVIERRQYDRPRNLVLRLPVQTGTRSAHLSRRAGVGRGSRGILAQDDRRKRSHGIICASEVLDKKRIFFHGGNTPKKKWWALPFIPTESCIGPSEILSTRTWGTNCCSPRYVIGRSGSFRTDSSLFETFSLSPIHARRRKHILRSIP
jgi:hypothetical protein